MKRIMLLLILLAGCSGIIMQEHSEAGSKYVLENNLTLILKENPYTSLAAIDILIKNSLADEEIPGINNFVNKMVVAGTKDRTRQEITEAIENVGGTLETRTYNEFSEIKIVVPSDKLSKALEILEDVLKNPTFEANETETERETILGDIKAKEDIPEVKAEELFLATLYEGHPFERPPEGTAEGVEKITREDLISHYKQNYVGNRIVIAIVGNIDEDATAKAIDYILSDLPEGEPAKPIPAKEPWKEARTKTLNFPAESFFVNQAYLIVPVTPPDFVPLRALQGTLGVGASSRLFQDLREKQGLAYMTFALMPSIRTNGFLRLGIVTKPSTLNQSLEGLKEEVTKIQQEKMDDKELQDVKTKMKGWYFLDHQKSIDQANYLALFETQGAGYEHDVDYMKKLLEVKPEDVQRVAKLYLRNPQTGIVGPFESTIR
ncbi:insulinase family protein [Candidatus Woesearchaeota archaeon]|nr:insulinase family protein [Candidatus Woesearchaeota archaeon]